MQVQQQGFFKLNDIFVFPESQGLELHLENRSLILSPLNLFLSKFINDFFFDDQSAPKTVSDENFFFNLLGR